MTNFVPLAEHQSATPASFYSGPPVLHYYSDRCKVLILEHELSRCADLAVFAEGSELQTQPSDAVVNGHSEEHGEKRSSDQKQVTEVDVWVTSE